MPGRVEDDLVDAVAVPVVGAQLGPVPVGLLAPLLRLRGAGEPAQPVQLVEGPPGTFADDALEQGRVVRHVVPDQRRRLVGHVVGRHPAILADPQPTRSASSSVCAGVGSADREPLPSDGSHPGVHTTTDGGPCS